MVEEKISIQANLRWRVADIAAASVIAVASALVYWVVAITSSAPWALFESVLPGFGGLMNGLWLFAGPLAAIIVRKPGAAIYAEVVAGVLEALLGNQWGGWSTFVIALVQGIGAEIAFAAFMYKRWTLDSIVLSGVLSGVGCWAYSFIKHFQGIDLVGSYGIAYLVTTAVSGAVIAGVLMWYLFKAVANTGALDHFASGREIHK
ncbi:ECF transporter S component [Gardnerella vaginalis]|uniref:ECF transporter S component n=1 Tax=Gardnerella vaginalis TaxID=2702 RepID=UPI0039EE4CF8